MPAARAKVRWEDLDVIMDRYVLLMALREAHTMVCVRWIYPWINKIQGRRRTPRKDKSQQVKCKGGSNV